MGELIRHPDWAASAVGVPTHQPQNLHTTLSTVLHAPYPMLLWWGPDLVQFYNDAYYPSLGNASKHPTALGPVYGIGVFQRRQRDSPVQGG